MKPFIPSWLDDAGLSHAEFRLYCHLCRRADKSGIAWPSVDGIDPDTGKPSNKSVIAVCGLARRTAWKAIKSLTEKGLIEKLGRQKFGSSNRYRILVPIGSFEAPNDSPIVSLEAPNDVSPIGANEAPSFDAFEAPSFGAFEAPGRVSKKEIQGRKSNREISLEGNQFAIWFKSSLPETISLETNWQQSFGEIYDKLIRIDKRDPEQIRAVCRWARTENFWKSRFMSPAKLRTRKDGIQYFDVFAEQMKQPSRPSHHQQSKATSASSLGGRESSLNKNTEAV